MSTRATIIVADEREQFHLYQHHDGYADGPHGIVRHLKAAQRRAWDLPRFEAADFTAAIIATLKDRGGSTYLTNDADAHSDRSFHYRISPLREQTQTTVGLIVSQARFSGPDRKIFNGSLEEAVDRFHAQPEAAHETSVWRVLDDALGTLARAEEQIGQRHRQQSDHETQTVLSNLNDAGLKLEGLRTFLQQANPWDALSAAEYALADIDAARRKGQLPGAKAKTFGAMDAYRRHQKLQGVNNA